MASSGGSVDEVVKDAVTGRLVPADDPEKMAGALIDLIRNRETRNQFGRNARALVVEEFDARRNIKKLASLLRI